MFVLRVLFWLLFQGESRDTTNCSDIPHAWLDGSIQEKLFCSTGYRNWVQGQPNFWLGFGQLCFKAVALRVSFLWGFAGHLVAPGAEGLPSMGLPPSSARKKPEPVGFEGFAQISGAVPVFLRGVGARVLGRESERERERL